MRHGKEIYLFFGTYGANGIIGIIISSLIIGAIIYKILTITKNKNIENYDDLLKHINQNPKISETVKIVINIFLLISFYIMIAGFSAYFSQELGLPNIIGTITIIILCYITFKGNIDRLIKVNTLLVPILIIFIILLTTKNIDAFTNVNQKMTNPSLQKSIYAAILYASYNSITLIPILIPLQKHIKTKKQIKQITLICILTLGILAISIFGLILKIDININNIELPTVYVASMLGKIYKYIYGLIILVAIFTSAISAGYSILENYTQNPQKQKTITILMCTSALLISKIGFSNLINLLYPIFGLLGIVQILFLVRKK